MRMYLTDPGRRYADRGLRVAIWTRAAFGLLVKNAAVAGDDSARARNGSRTDWSSACRSGSNRRPAAHCAGGASVFVPCSCRA